MTAVPRRCGPAGTALAPREKTLVGGAAALVGAGPAVVDRASGRRWPPCARAEEQHRALDDAAAADAAACRPQAQALQAQPRQSQDEAVRAAGDSRCASGWAPTARMAVAGDRVTVTLTGTPPDALAQWLTQARVNARALPGEARLTRNSGRRVGRHAGADPAPALKRCARRGTRPPHPRPRSGLGLGRARRRAGAACLRLVLFAPARWLAGAVEQRDRRPGAAGRRRAAPSGTAPAQLVLTGGAGSTDAVALPARLDWRLRPRLDRRWPPQLRRACCTTAAAWSCASARAGAACDIAGGRQQIAVAGGAAGRPGHALEHLATRRRPAAVDPGPFSRMGRRPAVRRRTGRTRGAADVVAPVNLEAHGQLPHHPSRGHHADPAARHARRQPAAGGQRPVGRLAPALFAATPARRRTARRLWPIS